MVQAFFSNTGWQWNSTLFKLSLIIEGATEKGVTIYNANKNNCFAEQKFTFGMQPKG